MLRPANVSDVHEVIALCKSEHVRGSYSHIEIDENKFKRLFAAMVCSKQAFVWVAEYEGEITAIIMGIIDEVFFSRKKYATDILFVSRRGGGYLIKRFIKWARDNPSVIDIRMGVSSDSGDPERVGKLYEGLGLNKIGGLYHEAIER